MGTIADLKALYDRYYVDPSFSHLRDIEPKRKFVPGAGPLQAHLMLIGEAPGRMENARGLPFVGRAGTILNNLLEDTRIDTEDVFYTNSVKYWPRQQEDDSWTPTEEEINASRPYLLEEINIVNPLIVGMCGRTSIHTLFPELNDVHKKHGQLLEKDGRKFVPLYHPALISYQPTKKSMVREGYTRLAAYLSMMAA